MKREKVLLDRKGKSPSADASIVRVISPVPPIGPSAVALAPFPLPKVPVRVSQYWTFTTGAGETPTLPIVAFQFFTMQVYDEFIRLLERMSAYPLGRGLHERKAFFTPGNVEKRISAIRSIFGKEPAIAKWTLDEMVRSKALSHDPKKQQMLSSLVKMYGNADNLYLNFYGPPGTITTVPYYQVVLKEEGTPDYPDLKGKAVFVGLSELLEPEQKDGFYTVFSMEDGRDISGVEIAATAFANLVEDRPVRPLGLMAHIAILLLWGLAMGILCRLLSTPMAAVSVTVFGVLYLAYAEHQFMSAGIWYPFFSPLFVQPPLAFFGAVLWKYVDANKERKNIREAFGYYLPVEEVDRLAKNISDVKTSSKLVYGVCLCTDVEEYCSLAETMEPEELARFMNKYYETLFGPVRDHGGVVSDVVGDAMLALWISVNPEAALAQEACLAALDISGPMNQLNRFLEGLHIRTRIGVHSGEILLGNIGAMGHYEYRAVGDMVNTTSRIEGLNKHLGTRILVSDEVLGGLEGFLTRKIGVFLMAGKSKPLKVHELLCPLSGADDRMMELCSVFQEGLDVFGKQSWDEAAGKFHEVARSFDDGPSRFYLGLCERFRESPPGESWDGVVRMDKK
jgi:adenylate cyclase